MTASARRKNAMTSAPAAKKARVRLAGDQDAAKGSPVHDQHVMLQAAFAGRQDQPYPVAVKAAIFIGAPTLMWAGIIYAGAQALRAFGG